MKTMSLFSSPYYKLSTYVTASHKTSKTSLLTQQQTQRVNTCSLCNGFLSNIHVHLQSSFTTTGNLSLRDGNTDAIYQLNNGLWKKAKCDIYIQRVDMRLRGNLMYCREGSPFYMQLLNVRCISNLNEMHTVK